MWSKRKTFLKYDKSALLDEQLKEEDTVVSNELLL